MVTFPNCKINLGLNITRKREDGFHDLETLFFPIPLQDALEIIPLRDGDQQDAVVSFSCSGLTINDDEKNNLCVRAYKLLKADFPELSSIKLHLHKVIPMGAGLGGGSADGAFTLKMLNQLFDLKLSTKQLINYALQLGSDCPFFIENTPCFATGRGEQLIPLTGFNLSDYKFVLINPRIHINTGWAFSQLHPAQPEMSIKDITSKPVKEWRGLLINDFEKPVFSQYPEIEKIKSQLYEANAVYAAMSGSGSTVFGIFEKHQLPEFDFPEEYFTWIQEN